MGSLPRVSPPNPPRPLNIQIPRPPPLDLPEIGLVGRRSSSQGSPTSSHRDLAGSPRQHERCSPKSSRGGTPQKGDAGAAASFAESSELPRRVITPVIGVPAPPPRTKAFSSSPQVTRLVQKVGTPQFTDAKKNSPFVPASERGKMRPVTSGVIYADTVIQYAALSI
jgi:hypothetical protein